MIEDDVLPIGWARTTLSSIAAINPRLNTEHLAEATTVSFVPMAAVGAGTGRLDPSEQRSLAEVRRGYTAFQDEDVIFAKITPCMENGKAAVAYSLLGGIGFGSTEFHVLRPETGVDPQLVYYYLSQESFRQAARTHMTGTAGQLRVPASFLHDAPYPLASLLEQRRIVAVIEQHFTRLEAGEAALRSARAKLKQYRAATLKAAVEGKLTAEWRAANRVVESGEELLERILAERRTRWEAETRAKGKDPAKVRYQEPAIPETAGLPELPGGWCWATVEQLASPDRYALAIGPFGSNLKVEDYKEAGMPLIFVRNIRSGVFDGASTKFVTMSKANELRPHQASPGDILITKMGDPPGDACLYPDDMPQAVITADCIKWTISPLLPEARYFVNTINSLLIRNQVLQITKGVAQPKVSLERFRSVAIPLPSTTEQEAIVAEVERRLSVVRELEEVGSVNLRRVERLRQSVLREAFAGRLVPQDPSDEPASALLERIRVARAEHEGSKERGSKGKGRATTTAQQLRLVDSTPERK